MAVFARYALFRICRLCGGAGNIRKKRIFVVSSYHPQYLWSQDTNRGFCEALLKLGYFDNKEQVQEYTKKDYIETSQAVIQKVWMDTKRKKDKSDIKSASSTIFKLANDFKPDIIFLGDDNAANYIGNLFLGTKIPVVFWGVNNTPVKYGLVDSEERPGHNVTGVYQSGYYIESLEFLKKIVPGIRTFAILSDNTPTGRSHMKKIEYLARKGMLPVQHVESVYTGEFEIWKTKALELQQTVDAFYIAQYSGLKDKEGNYVSTDEVARWQLSHIRIPETALTDFVKQGMLCTAKDSGYNQGYMAVEIAHDILANNADPAVYPPETPKRGALAVNKQRAKMLDITLTKEMGIEEYIEKADALKE